MTFIIDNVYYTYMIYTICMLPVRRYRTYQLYRVFAWTYLDVKHIEKFDGTNFQQWKHGLTMQLELSGLQDLVEVNVLSFKKGRFSI